MCNHMPSPQLLIGRRSIIGNVYAITMICRDRRLIFEDPADASIAMQVLEAMDQQGLTSSLAWVVMPDHLHWLAQLRESHSVTAHSASSHAAVCSSTNVEKAPGLSGMRATTTMRSALKNRSANKRAISWPIP